MTWWESIGHAKDFLKQMRVISENYNTPCKICLYVKYTTNKKMTTEYLHKTHNKIRFADLVNIAKV